MAFIRSVTIIRHEPAGTTADVVYDKDAGKRKVSKGLRPLEKAQRRMLKAQQVFGNEMLRRHEKSTRKRRNGFLRDGGRNHLGAMHKAIKKLI